MTASIDDPTAKAFDYARDNAKVLITLSTGVLTVSATVGTAFLGDAPWTGTPRWLIFVSWVLFLLSIGAGQLVLMSLVGAISPTGRDGAAKTPYAPTVHSAGLLLLTKVHQGTFVAALLALVAFGIAAVA